MKNMFLMIVMCMLPVLAQDEQAITRTQRETNTVITSAPGTTKIMFDQKNANEFYRALVANLSSFAKSSAAAYMINTITAQVIAHFMVLYGPILVPTSKKITVVDYSYINAPVDLTIAHPDLRVNGRYLLREQVLMSENGLYLRNAGGMLIRDTATENDFRTNGLGYGLVFSAGNPESICFYFPDAVTTFKFINVGKVGTGEGCWHILGCD